MTHQPQYYRYVIASIVIVVLMVSDRANGQIVLDRQPTHAGGFPSDTDFIDSFGNQVFQRLADDVQLSQTAIIRRITLWGFYGANETFPPEPAPATETLRVRWYQPDPNGFPGLPSVILAEESFLNPPRSPTGLTIGGGGGDPPEYKYQIDLINPFTIQANTLYWLEIVQLGGPTSVFRWERSSTGGMPLAYFNSNTNGEWHSLANSNTAFQLSTIPEPTSIGLILSGLILVKRHKERRQSK